MRRPAQKRTAVQVKIIFHKSILAKVLQMTSTQYDIHNTQYASRNTLHASRNSALHLSRELYKSTLFMQNEPNSPIVQDDTTALITRTYENLRLEISPKNKAKQSQNEPNFSSKLALFSPILALFWLTSSNYFSWNTRNPRLNNKYFYFICCIFRVLCYNAAKWRFNLSSLKSKPPIKTVWEIILLLACKKA
jgi:hypothetical protein